MNKEQAVVYLRFSGFSDEQIKVIEGAFTCEDAISRQAVIDTIAEFLYYPNDWDGMRAGFDLSDWEWKIKGVLSDVPPVNPQELKKGHWEDSNVFLMAVIGDTVVHLPAKECSICHKPHIKGYGADFCPNCGAKMVEPQEGGDQE